MRLIVTAAGVSPTYSSRFSTNSTTRVFGSLGFLNTFTGLTTKKGSVVRKIESNAATKFVAGGFSARNITGGPLGTVDSKPAKLAPLGNMKRRSQNLEAGQVLESEKNPRRVRVDGYCYLPTPK